MSKLANYNSAIICVAGVAVVQLGLFASGCRPPQYRDHACHDAVVQDGFLRMESVREFTTICPRSCHFITHFGFSDEPRTWNSTGYLYGKYIFSMQGKVSVDYDLCKVVDSKDSWCFYLHAVSTIKSHSDGRFSVTFDGTWELTVDQWRELVANGGDFDGIGIPLETNRPVAHFDSFAKAECGGRLGP